MSKKRTKQYLMLLMVIGLVSIAAGGGGGTFATFNAQVTNAGNYFATGSLFLHDTTSGTTCTSESATGNVNPGDGSNGDTCSSIFTVDATDAHAQYAQLTLKNAGSLDASDLKYALVNACSTAKVYESNTTLAADANAGDTSITVTTPLAIGIPANGWIRLDDGTNSEEVQVSNSAVGLTPSGGTINLASPLANSYLAATPTNVESSPQFAGGGDLCAGLDFNITETDSSFTTTAQNDTGTTGALGCAYGTATGGNDGCLFDNNAGDTLATLPTYGVLGAGLTTVNLATTPIAAGSSRYFLLGIKPDASFGNAYQDEKATFDLVWHIDQ